MHISRVLGMRSRWAAAAAVAGTLAVGLTGCGGGGGAADDDGSPAAHARDGSPSPGKKDRAEPLTRIPGVGARLRKEIPADSGQVVAVYGEGKNSGNSRVELFTRKGDTWSREKSWDAHNGRRGWTTDHHEGDKRSPAGVFTLSDAGGVLPDPGARLPYTHSEAFTPPPYWDKKTRHDFDYVIAVDYNRVQGTSPLDPTRPRGQEAGGGIWLHLDHGSGTSGCVSISKAGMEYLLRTLDPDRNPVVVMGDRATLAR